MGQIFRARPGRVREGDAAADFAAVEEVLEARLDDDWWVFLDPPLETPLGRVEVPFLAAHRGHGVAILLLEDPGEPSPEPALQAFLADPDALPRIDGAIAVRTIDLRRLDGEDQVLPALETAFAAGAPTAVADDAWVEALADRLAMAQEHPAAAGGAAPATGAAPLPAGETAGPPPTERAEARVPESDSAAGALPIMAQSVPADPAPPAAALVAGETPAAPFAVVATVDASLEEATVPALPLPEPARLGVGTALLPEAPRLRIGRTVPPAAAPAFGPAPRLGPPMPRSPEARLGPAFVLIGAVVLLLVALAVAAVLIGSAHRLVLAPGSPGIPAGPVGMPPSAAPPVALGRIPATPLPAAPISIRPAPIHPVPVTPAPARIAPIAPAPANLPALPPPSGAALPVMRPAAPEQRYPPVGSTRMPRPLHGPESGSAAPSGAEGPPIDASELPPLKRPVGPPPADFETPRPSGSSVSAGAATKEGCSAASTELPGRPIPLHPRNCAPSAADGGG